MQPTAGLVRELLGYNPTSGALWWLRKPSNRLLAGSIAGTITPAGYRRVGGFGDKRTYGAHHIAWLHFYSQWPGQLDHKNGNRSDNSIDNLRLATDSQNAANRKRRIDNRSGFKGVSWHKGTRRWCARISVRKKRRTIGYFPDPVTAHDAYKAASVNGFGEFARSE